VGGVSAGAALSDGVKTNALCEMYLLGEDDVNEYRFWCYELLVDMEETTVSEGVSACESEEPERRGRRSTVDSVSHGSSARLRTATNFELPTLSFGSFTSRFTETTSPCDAKL